MYSRISGQGTGQVSHHTLGKGKGAKLWRQPKEQVPVHVHFQFINPLWTGSWSIQQEINTGTTYI